MSQLLQPYGKITNKLTQKHLQTETLTDWMKPVSLAVRGHPVLPGQRQFARCHHQSATTGFRGVPPAAYWQRRGLPTVGGQYTAGSQILMEVCVCGGGGGVLARLQRRPGV